MSVLQARAVFNQTDADDQLLFWNFMRIMEQRMLEHFRESLSVDNGWGGGWVLRPRKERTVDAVIDLVDVAPGAEAGAQLFAVMDGVEELNLQ